MSELLLCHMETLFKLFCNVDILQTGEQLQYLI